MSQDNQAQKHKKALLVIFLTVFIDLVGFGIVIPLNPYLAKQFGGDAFDVGLLMSIYSIMQFVFSPFWGGLSDKFGRRPIILISLFGAGLSHLLFAFGSTLTMLFVARGLAGFFGANISTAMAYIADVTGEKERSKGMGLIGAAFGLGFVLGPFIGGIASGWGKSLGNAPPFAESFPAVVASIICLSNFVFAIFVLKESRDPSKQAVKKPSRLKNLRKFISQPELSRTMVCYFLLVLGMANMEASLFLLVKDAFDWSLEKASWGFAYVGIVIAFTQGFLVRKYMGKIGEDKAILFGMLLAALSFVGVGYSREVYLMAIAITFMALATGFANPALTGKVSLLVDKDNQGLAMGANQSLASLSRILGPALGGWLYRDMGWESPFVAAGAFCLIGVIVVSSKKKKESPKVDVFQLKNLVENQIPFFCFTTEPLPEKPFMHWQGKLKNLSHEISTFDEIFEKAPDKNLPIVLLCKNGNQSSKWAVLLEEKGYLNVFSLEGGVSSIEGEENS